jgi:6-phosphofructokinase 1
MARTANVLIGQAGGPTAVINQSLVALVESLRGARGGRRAPGIGRVLGMRHGIQGLLADDLIDLSKETSANLAVVARTPGAALGSARKKPTPDECRQALEILRRREVRWLFYIGGNDSAETALLLDVAARAAGYELALFHVPKTIDNDLAANDHCPGYPSAARFVAQATMGENLDMASLPGVKVNVIMGRHAGWLTAAAALGRRFEHDGPHAIYLPERAFSFEALASDVQAALDAHGRALACVSEGVHFADGRLVAEGKERDSHGNVQLSGSGALADLLSAELKSRLGAKLRVRADTYGYLQRSFVGCTSPVDARDARNVGRAAARAALAGEPRGSIALVRDSHASALSRPTLVELERVAQKTRVMEPEFLGPPNRPSDVSPAFARWLAPLVGPLPPTGRLASRRPT